MKALGAAVMVQAGSWVWKRAVSPLLLSLFVFILVSGAPGLSFSVDDAIVISSSPSPVGSGARATAMGSAFIAVADDATAASWNPAGLSQLERPEISIVGSLYHQKEEIRSDSGAPGSPSYSGDNSSNNLDLNFMSGVLPFELFNRNIVISASYQKRFDFSKDANISGTRLEGSRELYDSVDFEQSGGLAAVSPALSIQIIPTLSIGVAVNFWMKEFYRDNAWEVHTLSQGHADIEIAADNVVTIPHASEEHIRFTGFRGTNATFGLLWNVYGGLRVGGFYQLGFKASVDHHRTFIGKSGGEYDPRQFFSALNMDMPSSFGVGLSYRFSDSFMLTADYTRVHWDEFALIRESGEKTNLIDNPSGEGDPDPTNTVRIGGEYLWLLKSAVIPIRAGAFYDPQPASGSPNDYFGFSLGSGIVLKRFQIDGAYQLRIGRGDEDSNLLDITGEGFFEGVDLDAYQHRFLLSVIVYLF